MKEWKAECTISWVADNYKPCLICGTKTNTYNGGHYAHICSYKCLCEANKQQSEADGLKRLLRKLNEDKKSINDLIKATKDKLKELESNETKQ